ncbi:hypothetical protein HYD44_03815 [Mycoplasmopsis bovis]|nr:hypothetical protein [Mycoplasmopsis bovis]QQH83846.1 hypothetical protein HYD44_03815 [Mycoplasmopsis bovis]
MKWYIGKVQVAEQDKSNKDKNWSTAKSKKLYSSQKFQTLKDKAIKIKQLI